MNGAESLVHTLLKSGVDTCFANPGTSEMHFVAALDRIPGMRCVLGLQENIVTGMADGYWRMAEKPAATLLHCGPGLANGLANLHNARRARSGIVNVVGDQATYHRPYDAQLTADTEGWARPVSAWVRTATDAKRVGADAAVAVQAARTAPGQIATLILPADTAWNEGAAPAEALPVPAIPAPDPHAVRVAARTLREKKNVLILLGGMALRGEAQALAWRIAQATGQKVLAEMSNARVERGRGRMQLERVPYPVDMAIEALKGFEHLILVNAKAPVGFFAYPNKPSIHYPETASVHVLSRYEEDGLAALRALVDELGAPEAAIPDPGPRPQVGKGAPTPEGLARTVAALIPEGGIVADESVSFGRGFYKETHAAPPHDWLHITGGAIGCGMPLATGAAIGAGGQRRVINLQADGSGMYTLQALWTQARERLPVTTIVLANRKYQILLGEYQGVGANPGPTAMSMLDLGNPDLDWCKLAGGMGVEAARATTLEQCADLLAQSCNHQAPFLIELMI
ncbi:acetolactate synthase large subunit [Pseudoroseomonas cervicalis]|uniref:Thiamine pyrophosphate enzyme, C-terminal TPP binding domain protein n=1 Tax=Pseudoroseomonas cervicalis ATCC 49957 TaxID=525371 RepID=D5RSK6_9PROT|nr:acetolactate synthase large subunit [Pseudoroseomonas cervicalis]EFH09707.1 thiamine pyrophosphate enzyme, C-terminal TPP binding domain protein [Pseudoroseomonas cervicalis ATCC 49957]